MNSKIEKIAFEIERIKVRMDNDQARLKDLERQKTELENTEIISVFRSINASPAELAAFLRSYKKNGDFTSDQAAALDSENEQYDDDDDSDLDNQEEADDQ